MVTVDGAWMNLKERKLFIPSVEVTDVFSQMPIGEDFQWLD